MYSGINIVGLAISLTCVIIISRYVYNELSVERYNSKLDRIFTVRAESPNNPGRIVFTTVDNSDHKSDSIDVSRHPGIERYSEIRKYKDQDISVDNQLYNTDILIVDTNFLHIMDYPITGAANLSRPEDAFITETFAKKIFGDKNPIGEKLIYSISNKELTIIGVIGKTKTKSLFMFDIIIATEVSDQWFRRPDCLIMLYPNVNYKDVNKQYGKFISSCDYKFRYQLFPYKDIYLSQNDEGHFAFNKLGNYMFMLILSIVGVLLLLIGLINYINIYTVVILRRNKEFGMKKVFGAEGYKIFFQLHSENLILTFFSLILAFGLAEFFSPFVTWFFELEQILNTEFDFLLAIVLLLALPVITSILPFIRYHYASPIRSLNAVGIGGKSLFSRKFFLCLQYFITFVMIVVSLFFVKQLNFMLDKDLGYRTKDIIKVPFNKNKYGIMQLSNKEMNAVEEKKAKIGAELKQKLDACPLLEHWTYGWSPSQLYTSKFNKVPDGELKETTFSQVDESWLKLFEIQLVDGRLWDNEKDHYRTPLIIVGESTLKLFGITDFREAEMDTRGKLWTIEDPPFRIAGVIKDFYPANLSQKQYPVILAFYPLNASSDYPVMASFRPENKKDVIEFMKKLHDEIIGGEFNYTFIEDEVADMYKEDKKIAVIYSVFTGIAILISILGLFSLSLFDMQQRRKEIAIRKVNGATTMILIRLLLKKYFTLLGIAFVVSVPVALFAILKYLENFVLKTTVSWWLFLVALIITAAVSTLTLIYQTYKASNENPAKVVKSE
jgi:ABC-type antimicrobial peptide transport system permease subunit